MEFGFESHTLNLQSPTGSCRYCIFLCCSINLVPTGSMFRMLQGRTSSRQHGMRPAGVCRMPWPGIGIWDIWQPVLGCLIPPSPIKPTCSGFKQRPLRLGFHMSRSFLCCIRFNWVFQCKTLPHIGLSPHLCESGHRLASDVFLEVCSRREVAHLRPSGKVRRVPMSLGMF